MLIYAINKTNESKMRINKTLNETVIIRLIIMLTGVPVEYIIVQKRRNYKKKNWGSGKGKKNTTIQKKNRWWRHVQLNTRKKIFYLRIYSEVGCGETVKHIQRRYFICTHLNVCPGGWRQPPSGHGSMELWQPSISIVLPLVVVHQN